MIDLPAEGISGQKLEEYLETKVFPVLKNVRERLEGYSKWVRNEQDVPNIVARHNNKERQILQELSRAPWIGLMVSTFAQQLIVDGYRKSGSSENAKAWDTWQRNEMGKQQFALNRAVIMYGYAFMKVTDGVDPISDEQMARMKVVSPMNALPLYEDPYWDEWPKYMLEKQPNGDYWWWDDEQYTILKFHQDKFTVVDTVEHEYGLVPFVRYANQMDLEGRCTGDVEPIIEVARCIDKTKLDLLLSQHHQGFMIRYGTGLQMPDSEDTETEKMRVAQESFLVSANPQAKFGVLPSAPLDGLIQAYKESLTQFLALCQLPAHIAGQIVNVAADALAAGTRSTMQKLFEKQSMWKSGHNQALRLVNIIEHRAEEAKDISFSVHWQDVTVQSLAQFADAWGKIVQMLKVPAEGTWDMIPNIDQSVVDGWHEIYAKQPGGLEGYMRMLQESGTAGRGGAAGLDPRGGPTGGQNSQKPNNKTGEPASMNKSGR